MNKMVFFDIDGTLLDHDKNLPASTKKAVQMLKDKGIFVAIATGRAPFMYESLRKELDIDSFVSFNGQYVVFENEVIYKNPLKTEDLEVLAAHSGEKGHPLVHLTDHTMKANHKHHPFIEESMGSLKMVHPEYEPEFYQENEIYQSLLFCGHPEEHYYRDQFNQFKLIRWHDYSVDILPRGGSKAEGIKQMISRVGLEFKDVYAFGDGFNDVEMLESVGTGVAMGNAHPSVKEFADHVTEDVAQEGIYKGLKKLELI
ncbi:Cof-type HAD-IIB family hydrolase [Falsibacillus albus]|uniref:Cof-type HAD-IIB family hydrolase n=1 Tax=Falsibacillus albus TaxID=2478915 RepID=A0A3L7K0C5_9BACI|nr:Cof-type HAD-IIB family hydrolase [Falsibacillus albus]RLQ95914.1 Cof-type HAD-IIB family hydrolase [Falsibacillus albus]